MFARGFSGFNNFPDEDGGSADIKGVDHLAVKKGDGVLNEGCACGHRKYFHTVEPGLIHFDLAGEAFCQVQLEGIQDADSKHTALCNEMVGAGMLPECNQHSGG